MLEFIKQLPGLFNWYFLLPQIKRIQLNYIVLLSIVIAIGYYNDKRHRENYCVILARVDIVNDSRAKEQEKYTTKLEYYTDKFNHLLELLIEQKKEQQELKKKL